MKKSRLVCCLLALVILLGLTACAKDPQPDADPPSYATPATQPNEDKIPDESPDSTPASTVSDKTLKVCLNSEPTTLCVQYATPFTSDVVISNAIYDTLVFWNAETGKVEPMIATSWEWIDDTHIRFELRDDVYAYDGSKITASDVVYSFAEGFNGTNLASFSGIFDPDNFVIEDENTVVMALATVYPNIIDMLGNVSYAIISQSCVEDLGGMEAAARNPKIGTGKYKFKEWADGQYIILERNDDYWNKDDMAYFKEVNIAFISDAASRFMSLQSGDVDVVNSMSAVQAATVDDSVEFLIDNVNTCKVVYFNCSEEPFDDERVREAVYQLIDVDAINALILAGNGVSVETSVSKASSYYSAPEAGYERKVDIEKAKALLTEAGYPDGLTVTCANVTAPNAKLAELIKANLAEGGINLELEMVDGAAGMANMGTGNYKCYISSAMCWNIVKILDRIDGRVPVNVAGGGAQYNNDELNTLIDKARYTVDDTARYEAYAEVQSFIREHNILIGLYNDISYSAYRSGLKGVKYDMLGFIDIRDIQE